MEKTNKTLDNFVKATKKNTNGKRKADETDDQIKETLTKKLKQTKSPKKVKGESHEINTDTDKNITSTSTMKDSNPKTDLDTNTLSSFGNFISGLGTWEEPLKTFINSDKMKKIYNFIKKEYESNIVYPPQDLIFNAFNRTSWDNIKVVVIGQDPYPNVGQAMGLSFSVNMGIPVPKSLVNIYKCLQNDSKLSFKTPKHGDLSKWADQGVFLLNATLTVKNKLANSHQKTSGWSDFTDFVIKTISEKKDGIVFLLWGKFAIDKKKLINGTKHFIIENIHPSPLAATKGDFSKSTQFSDANEYLVKHGRVAVNWNL